MTRGHGLLRPAMCRQFVTLLALVLCAACTTSFGQGRRTRVKMPPRAVVPIRCSIINLAATPEKYHGELVAVVGYFRFDFELSALYLSQEHARMCISKNAIWLDFDDSFFDGLEVGLEALGEKYILAIGIFNKNQQGHLDGFQGTIEKIKRVAIMGPVGQQ